MEHSPLVSIIIPVFNGSNYLKEAIESAINQTYPNIQVIVVNDGSNDEGKTKEIALSFGNKVTYYEKKNGGVSTALNMGIERMKGEYFSWLSHDDRYRPEKISSQMKIINELEDKTTIVYGGYVLIDELGKVFYEVVPHKTWSKEQLDKPLFPIFKGLINGCSPLIHKSHFDRVGNFNEKLLNTQDMDLWFRMFRGQKLYYQYDLNVETRIHGERGSVNTSKNKEVNTGWIERMHHVTVEEMRQTMGSPKAFYKEIIETLKGFKDYKIACGEAQKLLDIYSHISTTNNKVSVIIPFYNRVDYVIRSITSVMEQTYKNIEIIVVDDGSTEDLTDLRQFITKDSRIKYISQEHLGTSVARNTGIEAATGDYIAFLDSDDIFFPSKIEKQLKFMLENEYVFSHTSYERMTINEEPIKVMPSVEYMNSIAFPQILNLCSIATSTVMVKKIALGENRFPKGMAVSQDICMWIDLAYEYELGGLNESLVGIRIGETTTFYNKSKVKRGSLNVLNHIFSNENYLKEEEAISIFLRRFADLFLKV